MVRNMDKEWQRNFLERFRKDILKIDPALQPEILFNVISIDQFLQIFGEVGTTASDPLFFTHLIDATDGIEFNADLLSDVRTV